MLEMVGIGLAIGAGVDPRRLAVLAGALYLPAAVLGLAALAIWTNRRAQTTRSALFCEGVAAELRSGANLRDALSRALTSVRGTAHEETRNLADLTDEIAMTFEDIGVELKVSIGAAAKAGASVADLFDEIGSFAIARSEVDNEVRIATAPARVTAFVFLAAPVLFVGSQACIRGFRTAGVPATPEGRRVGWAGAIPRRLLGSAADSLEEPVTWLVLGGSVGMLVGGLPGALIGVLSPIVVRRFKNRPDPAPPIRLVLLLLLIELRSGLSVLASLRSVSDRLPTHLSLRRVARVASVSGLTVSIAYADESLRPVVAQLARAQRSGAPLSQTVRRLIDQDLAAERTRRMAKARALPVKLMIPLTLLMLPGLVLLLYAPSFFGLLDDLTGAW